MSQPIVYVDVSTIRPGKLSELEAAMVHLARFVAANMPRLEGKARMLGSGTVTVHALHAGFAR